MFGPNYSPAGPNAILTWRCRRGYIQVIIYDKWVDIIRYWRLSFNTSGELSARTKQRMERYVRPKLIVLGEPDNRPIEYRRA